MLSDRGYTHRQRSDENFLKTPRSVDDFEVRKFA